MKKLYILTLLALFSLGLVNAQIVQVTDINTTADAGIASPTLYNSEIFFEADDGVIGDELYKIIADGTVILVKDINTDAEDTSPNGDPKWFIEYNGKLYFNANDGDNGADKHDNELWVTDGTTEGTQLAYDIWPGGAGNASNPQQFFVFNGNLYFQAKYETSTQIWRYNGTDAPVKITDIRENGYATPFFPCVDETNGKVYFKVNNDGKYELGVLKADESYEVIDINDGDHGFPGTEAGIIYKDKFYYDGDNGVAGDELVVSDGTAAGTALLKDIYDGGDSDPNNFTIYNDELYFFADVATGMQLWKTDGTTDGTVMVAEPFVGGDADMDDLTLYNGKLYFSASDGTNGVELWVYDGTTASMLKDLNVEAGIGSNPAYFYEVEDLLFFEADTGSGVDLWVTDGTENGTVRVSSLFAESELPGDIDGNEFVAYGPYLFFSGDDAAGDDLFMVDVRTISEKVQQATDINTSGDSGIGTPYAFNGEVFFEADDGTGTINDELYKISADGSVVLVKDINTDAEDTSPNGDPKWFIEYNGKLYFNANDGDNGADKHDNELWVTDGTTEGTQLAYDIWPGGAGNASNPQQFFVFNGNLYFQAKYETSTQVWRYNGTDAPVKITTIREDGYATPFFPCVDETNGKVYFKVNNDGKYELGVLKADESYEVIDINDGDHGFPGTEAGIVYKDKFYYDGDNGVAGDELVVSDGTAAGTALLKDIYDGGDSDPNNFTIYNDELYFFADVATGMQLWKTDGTTDGTVMVAEPFVGGDADMDDLTLYNGKLYFSASDGTNGVELWVYDGTTASMLRDIDPAVGVGSNPADLLIVDGLLFFTASVDGVKTVWVSDGTSERTLSLAEALNTLSTPVNANLSESANVGTVLYYTADDENGFDDIYSVDTKLLFSEDVTFVVTDENGPVEGAQVVIAGYTVTTGADGRAVVEYVRMGTDIGYVITKDKYLETTGTVTVDDMPVLQDAVLVLAPTYEVTFSVSDGTNALEGAEITFAESTMTTDASGMASFAGLYPAADMPYTVSLAGYETADGTITIVDQNVDENVALTLITYSVTFTVTDGTSAIQGATVSFEGTDATTDASGVASFSGIAPAADLAYSVTADGYLDASGTVNVVDSDVAVDVSLDPTAVFGHKYQELSVYPNPSNGKVYVEGVATGSTYMVYSMNLSLVESGDLDNSSIQLQLKPGMYILKVNSEGETLVKKLVIR